MPDTWNLDPWTLWMIAGVVLLIAEIVVPGFFLIWIGAAALLTGVVTLVFGIAEPVQFLIFAVAAVAAVYAGRRWIRANPIETADPMLNNRAARLVGQVVPVTQAIVDGRGRVRVGDTEWLVQGPDTPTGGRVRIAGADGSTLIVDTV